MASSFNRMINAAGLLEAVLLKLDNGTYEGLSTLLLSQRVQRAFKATIEGSQNIQRALYFEETPTDEIAPGSNANRLVSRRFKDSRRFRHIHTPEGCDFFVFLDAVRDGRNYSAVFAYQRDMQTHLSGSWLKMRTHKADKKIERVLATTISHQGIGERWEKKCRLRGATFGELLGLLRAAEMRLPMIGSSVEQGGQQWDGAAPDSS